MNPHNKNSGPKKFLTVTQSASRSLSAQEKYDFDKRFVEQPHSYIV